MAIQKIYEGLPVPQSEKGGSTSRAVQEESPLSDLTAGFGMSSNMHDVREIREELRMASLIQRALLPKGPPEVPGYDVACMCVPAREVGGDYFDFLRSEAEHWVVCLGDVCGKGLPASLLMANVQAIVRTQTLFETPGRDCHPSCRIRFCDPARQCMERSNRLLCRNLMPERFVTLFYGILDTEQHALRYCNAGQNPPLLCRPGHVQRLTTGGIPLGICEDWRYLEGTVGIEPGDLLALFTDGWTEAFGSGGSMFGESRLAALLKENLSKSPSAILEILSSALREHLGGWPPGDDMTLILIQRGS